MTPSRIRTWILYARTERIYLSSKEFNKWFDNIYHKVVQKIHMKPAE
jgi:hypothetical protein